MSSSIPFYSADMWLEPAHLLTMCRSIQSGWTKKCYGEKYYECLSIDKKSSSLMIWTRASLFSLLTNCSILEWNEEKEKNEISVAKITLMPVFAWQQQMICGQELFNHGVWKASLHWLLNSSGSLENNLKLDRKNISHLSIHTSLSPPLIWTVKNVKIKH